MALEGLNVPVLAFAFMAFAAGLYFLMRATDAAKAGAVEGGGGGAQKKKKKKMMMKEKKEKKTGGAPQRLTKEEVSKHNKADDLWVIIDGKVYDVTDYVDTHPGGEDAIMQNAGGDASEGFHGDQHPEHVQDTVEQFFIGRLDEKKNQ